MFVYLQTKLARDRLRPWGGVWPLKRKTIRPSDFYLRGRDPVVVVWGGRGSRPVVVGTVKGR